MGDDILTLLGMLAAVAAILAVAYWCTRLIARRGQTISAGGSKATGEMCILGQLSLGRSERIVLVRVHDRCLLVGVTEHSMSLITELSDEEADVWIAQQDDAPQPPSFLEALRGTISKKK